jgi:prepilin-type processing-associated H-X9-DG protein
MLDEMQQRKDAEFSSCRRALSITKALAVAIFCYSLVVSLFLIPSLVGHPGASRRSTCKNNLTQFAIALLNYHETHGSFPPAYVNDKDGRPLYSWRVLILPEVDQQPLYDQLRLDEPWDSPHNRPLLDVDIPVFCCPSDENVGKGMTNYFAVIGPETVWPAPDACRLDDITDHQSTTILVVEVANTGIHWAEPRDLHVSQMAGEVNPTAGMGLSSRHTGGTQVLRVDGSVRFIADDTPEEQLRAMLTRAGGEVVDDDY